MPQAVVRISDISTVLMSVSIFGDCVLPARLGLADAAPAAGPEHLRLVEGEHLALLLLSPTVRIQ